MLNLLNRLETYFSILRKYDLRSSELPTTVSKPKSGFPRFLPSREVASARKAATAKSAAAKTAAVKPSRGVKQLVMVKKSTKQYAMSTVQGQAEKRTSCERSRYCSVDRFGWCTRGQQKFTTSALGN